MLSYFLLIISKIMCKMVAHIIKFLNSWKIWSVDSCHSKRTPAVIFNLSMMELTVHLCSHFLLEIRLPWTHVLFPFLNYQLRGRTFCFWTKISIRLSLANAKWIGQLAWYHVFIRTVLNVTYWVTKLRKDWSPEGFLQCLSLNSNLAM